MPTRTRTSRSFHRSSRRSAAPGRIGDASTIRNPYARVRGGSRRPAVATDLCEVIDRTAEGIEPRLVFFGCHSMSWDNMARWSIRYACRYHCGRRDMELHERDLISATRTGAIDSLRHGLIGFGVESVEIFAIRPPLTRDQVAAVAVANDELDLERRRLGIYGEGEPRQKAIERWLRSDRSYGLAR